MLRGHSPPLVAPVWPDGYEGAMMAMINRLLPLMACMGLDTTGLHQLAAIVQHADERFLPTEETMALKLQVLNSAPVIPPPSHVPDAARMAYQQLETAVRLAAPGQDGAVQPFDDDTPLVF